MTDGCFCGAGQRLRGTVLEVTPHAIGCLWLAWVVTLHNDGVCAYCGEAMTVQVRGIWKHTSCRTCGTYETEMRWVTERGEA